MITSRLLSSLATICLIVFSLHSRALVAGEVDKSSLIKTGNPKLPEMSGKVEIEVRDSVDKPARKLPVHLVYSRNRLSTVTEKTGIMLTLSLIHI